MENKNGFISTALVYSFLVIYLFLMVSIINLYLQKNTYIEALDEQVAEDIGITKNTKTSLLTAILRDNVALETSRIEWDKISGSALNNGRGLFYIDENGLDETEEPKYTDEDNNGFGGKIYFFRGNVENNNVVFGYQFTRTGNEIDDASVKQMCWLVLRTTENGSIKLLYNGIYNDGKCDSTNNTINNYVEGNTYNTVADYRGQYNRNNNDNAYVGYTYGTAGSTSFDATHYDTQNNSDIKSAVEDFYFRNTSLYKYTEFGYGYDAGGVDTGTSTDDILLASRYEEVEDVVYCNDRQYECVEVSTIPDEKPCGYSTKSTNYGYKTQKDMVTYICPKFYDKYMLDDGYAGGSDDVTNLNFAVALPTASEIIMAGGSLSENNDGYFLKSGSGYWTMSPSSFDGTAKVYSVDGNGKVVPTDVNTQLGIRPVISIESEVGVSYGSGLADEPYMLN